jgi:hypothetical protein
MQGLIFKPDFLLIHTMLILRSNSHCQLGLGQANSVIFSFPLDLVIVSSRELRWNPPSKKYLNICVGEITRPSRFTFSSLGLQVLGDLSSLTRLGTTYLLLSVDVKGEFLVIKLLKKKTFNIFHNNKN